MEELFFDFFDDGLCTYKNCSGPYKITYSKMSVEITPTEEQNMPIKKAQLEGLGPNLFA